MLREVDVDVDLPARYLPVKLSERPWNDFLANILLKVVQSGFNSMKQVDSNLITMIDI